MKTIDIVVLSLAEANCDVLIMGFIGRYLLTILMVSPLHYPVVVSWLLNWSEIGWFEVAFIFVINILCIHMVRLPNVSLWLLVSTHYKQLSVP